MLNNLEIKLSQLKKKYQKKYGVAVFDAEIKKCKKGLMIKGIVLTENQRDEIFDLVKSVVGTGLKPVPTTIKIKILSDPKQRNEISWAAAKNKTADLKSRFVSNKIVGTGFKPVLASRILKRIKASEIFKNEILRVLYKKEDQLLVQQQDMTIGWVNRKEVVMKKKNSYQEWKSCNFALRDKRIKRKLPKLAKRFHSSDGTMEPTRIIKEAKKYLGAPYLLGGKTKKGIDCSGLVQMAYQNSSGIILPRHSRDQRKLGRKIKLENSEAGDLVFFEKLKNRTSHVGLVCDNAGKVNEILIIHSCRENKGVKIQELGEVLKRYEIVEVRIMAGN